MPYALTTPPATSPAISPERRHQQAQIFARWVLELPERALMALYLRQRRHQERRELAELDAHQLRDVGLTRADIDESLNRPVWR